MSTNEKPKTFIPAETVNTEVQVWDLPYWANPPPEPPSETSVAETALSFPTVEEVEAIRQTAYDDGFQQGSIEGRKQGHQAGFAKGQGEGLAQGKQQGTTQGLAEGRQQGFEQGLAEANEKIEFEIAALKQVVQQLLDPIKHQQAALEVALADLIEQSVRAVLRVPLQLAPNDIASIAHEALAALPIGAQNIKLYLNAVDQALIADHWSEALPAALHIDDSLTSGGCRVETATSLIDFSVEERLRQVLEALCLDHFPEHNPLAEVTELTEMDKTIPSAQDEIVNAADSEVTDKTQDNPVDETSEDNRSVSNESGTDVPYTSDDVSDVEGDTAGDSTDES